MVFKIKQLLISVHGFAISSHIEVLKNMHYLEPCKSNKNKLMLACIPNIQTLLKYQQFLTKS